MSGKEQARLDSAVDLLFDDLADTGERIVWHEGLLYLYHFGFWRPVHQIDIDKHLLERIKRACDAGSVDYAKDLKKVLLTLKTRAIGARPAYGLDPDPNDTGEGPYLATPDATIDLGCDPLLTVEHAPDHWTTQRVGIDFDPSARCPGWLAMLDRMLEDRSRTAADIADIKLFLQEWVGVNLVGPHAKPTRSLKSGLIIEGPSNTGKSTFAGMMAELVGVGGFISPTLKSLSGDFGRSVLIGNRPLISDDGIQVGSKGDAALLKRIITGEPMTVNRKFMDEVQIRYTGAVLWTTNVLPEIDDESAALYNRFVLVTMSRVFTTEDAVRDFGGRSPIQWLKDEREFPGILNWALEGYARAYDRGRFRLPACCQEASEAFRRKNDWAYAALQDLFETDAHQFVHSSVVAAVVSEYAQTSFLARVALKDAASSARRTLTDVHPTARWERDDRNAYFEGLRLSKMGKTFWNVVNGPDRNIPQLKGIKEPWGDLV